MTGRTGRTGRAGFAGLVTVLMAVGASALSAQRTAQDAQRSAPGAPQPAPATAIAVFSGGCFWGVQAVFEHVKGVIRAESGYTGGKAEDAHYETVSTGRTGHAESVRVVYDPSQVSYQQLLDVFFGVAHDPTQLNRQGPDHGTQYRSAIWFTTPAQRAVAVEYIARLNRSGTLDGAVDIRINLRGANRQAARRFLSGRGLSPGLLRQPSRIHVHCVQRCTQGESAAAAVPGALAR